jgi:hypothetical protein
VTDCLGKKLPERWWRSTAPCPCGGDHRIIEHEREAHGTCATAGRAHGTNPGNVTKAWSDFHGLPKIPTGPTAETHLVGEPVDERETLRARVSELEAHLKRVREGEVAEERVVQRIEAAIVKGGLVRTKFTPRKVSRSSGATELALLLSDTHASEVVRLEETEGMNAYDWQIMADRLRRVVDGVLSHREHHADPITRLHIWALGDMLSGDIHEELAITNDRPTAEAVVDFAVLFADLLDELANHFDHIDVAGVPGNHPRPTKKPAAKQAHNNADWLTYKMVEALLRDHPRIRFQFKRGAYKTAMVAERWRVLLMHGDGIRTTMPGVPWGGVVRRVTTLEQQFAKAKQPLDYVALGHFHTANTLDGVGARTFLNGSVKGLDEYSLKQFGSGRDASQLLLAFNEQRGWTGTFPLNLQDVTPASEGWAEAA